MTRAISRDSFSEFKQYLGVYLQQGRVLLDSDWNEGQDIMSTLARRLGQDTFGDGFLDEGFDIQPVIPTPWQPYPVDVYQQSYQQGLLPVSARFPPNAPFDAFESKDGWAVEGSGNLRLSRDRPYEGKSFLRLSDHTGQVTVARTLGAPVDLSQLQFGHVRFRLNQSVPNGCISFFVEDTSHNRNVWQLGAPWIGNGRWAPGAALPLDLKFQLFDIDLLPAIKSKPYESVIPALGTTASLTWSFTGTLPPGLSFSTTTAGSTPLYGRITGTPTTPGTFTFTAIANAGGPTASRQFTLVVQDTPVFAQPHDVSVFASNLISAWNGIKARTSTVGSGPANLASINKYGFVITAAGGAPAVWDFDALYFSSRALVQTKAMNNFAIGGPLMKQVLEVYLQAFQTGNASESGDAVQILAALPLFSATPRAYVGGVPCTQPKDLLYTDQADPRDPAITTPTALRKDLVYLDVWREPVTYIEDPDLREVALGGPDTSTRMRVRQRIRVAQGATVNSVAVLGALPTGDGTGGGTLATEGTYSDRSNRLYLVEVDTAGNLGTATVRWSDDNASTIQRVIEAIAPGTTKVKLEDASAFRQNDVILIRTDFREEEHRISSVLGNTITLGEVTGSSAFALADRPKIQRWNAFHAPVVADANDSTLSAPINLSFGVKVRFGGRGHKKGDFWTFRTRYLAGDDAAGVDGAGRIETVDFLPPQGVVHQYSPLAVIIRDPAALYPDRIQLLRDQRSRGGRIAHHRLSFPGGTLDVNHTVVRSPFLMLGPVSRLSSLMCFFSLFVTSDAVGRLVTITVDLFNNDMTNPDSDTGKIGGASTALVAASVAGSTQSATVAFDPAIGAVAARVTLQWIAGAVTLGGRLDILELSSELRAFATENVDL